MDKNEWLITHNTMIRLSAIDAVRLVESQFGNVLHIFLRGYDADYFTFRSTEPKDAEVFRWWNMVKNGRISS